MFDNNTSNKQNANNQPINNQAMPNSQFMGRTTPAQPINSNPQTAYQINIPSQPKSTASTNTVPAPNINKPLTQPVQTPLHPPRAPMSLPMQVDILNEEEQKEMIHRDKLSRMQKIILLIIAFIVVSSLIGGGIWLYFTINPFSEDTASLDLMNKNVNQTIANGNINSANTNESIPTAIDSDSDGLIDDDEIKYGTDKNNPDTDGDTYLDGAEVKNGYNPNGPGKLSE